MQAGKYILGLTIATILASIVFASVFVYYPASVQVSPRAPPVIFEEGSNSNQRDLYGETITTDIDATGTSASITLHPTYQRTYYKDVLRIKNQDSEVYYVKVNVVSTITGGNIVSAKIHVYRGDVKVGEIDLLTTGLQPDSWIALNGNGELRIDLEFRYATTGGSHDTAPPGSGTISLELVYSTVNNETPP
ncbi:MAG: hypothetical protein ACO2OS_06730 [Thermosphaera aggregans]|jgi:hypothetical protein|uniref:hypothetical protein n=1 Tax=Thermosphaera aggregans TaxID=54254 RepID=UPI003C0615AF